MKRTIEDLALEYFLEVGYKWTKRIFIAVIIAVLIYFIVK